MIRNTIMKSYIFDISGSILASLTKPEKHKSNIILSYIAKITRHYII